MAADIRTASRSRSGLWAGRIMTGLVVVFLLFDSAMKFTTIAPVVEASSQLGIPMTVNPAIGVILLVCLAVYAYPPTAVLGAILLTGYLGGAIALHVRVGNPLFSHVLFPIYVAALLWGGLYVRDARLRALVPVRSPA